jgi:hypothetical protein
MHVSSVIFLHLHLSLPLSLFILCILSSFYTHFLSPFLFPFIYYFHLNPFLISPLLLIFHSLILSPFHPPLHPSSHPPFIFSFSPSLNVDPYHNQCLVVVVLRYMSLCNPILLSRPFFQGRAWKT